jgi:hypothetical protein
MRPSLADRCGSRRGKSESSGGCAGKASIDRGDTATRRRPRDASETRFVALIGIVLVAGVAIVLAVHAVRPIVVDRYLFAVPVLVSALMAVPAAQDRLLFGLLTLVAVAGAATPLVETGIRPLWRENARTVATIVAGCPTTQVYAASGWALGPAAQTRAARREDPVFERAYRTLAAPWGYTVKFIGQNGSAHATPGACPVLLWYEHTPNEAENDLPAAIEAAGLTGLQEARLSVTAAPRGSSCAQTGDSEGGGLSLSSRADVMAAFART